MQVTSIAFETSMAGKQTPKLDRALSILNVLAPICLTWHACLDISSHLLNIALVSLKGWILPTLLLGS